MNFQTSRIVIVFLFSIVAGVSGAVPIPILNVPALAASSDLIVAGNVVSLRDEGATSSAVFSGGSVPARLILCEVDVNDVLKGRTEGPRIAFRYALPSEPIGFASVALGYQILFLKTANQGYSLASPYHASLPAVPLTISQGSDEIANIATVLGGVLQSAPAPLAQKQMALYALSTIHTSVSTELLRKALEQVDPVLRLNAAGFLLQRNDLSGMENAEQALLNPGRLPGNLLHNLDYAIAEGVKNKEAVPMLSRLAHAQGLETRRAAASALRHTGDKSALAPLAHLLNDDDLHVRHEAILGLAEITGDLDWGPNLDLFQSQEQKYLKHWQEWASANGLSM